MAAPLNENDIPDPATILACLKQPLTHDELRAALWNAWGRARQIEVTRHLVNVAVQRCLDSGVVVARQERRKRYVGNQHRMQAMKVYHRGAS